MKNIDLVLLTKNVIISAIQAVQDRGLLNELCDINERDGRRKRNLRE